MKRQILIITLFLMSNFLFAETIGSTANWNVGSHTTEYSPAGNTLTVQPTGAVKTVLTIDGVKLKFLNTTVGKITVKKGATLILKNIPNVYAPVSGTFSYWAGITVEGDASLPQYTGSNLNDNQGILIIENTTLTNADIAVLIQAGGIVKTLNCYFTNNKYGIQIEPYDDPNRASNLLGPIIIQTTDFKWDNNYNTFFFPSTVTTNNFEPWVAEMQFLTHVWIKNTKNIVIRGCGFFNTQPASFWGYTAGGDAKIQPNARGVGVLSDNSSIYVNSDGPCNTIPNQPTTCHECDGSPNLFRGLYTGIEIANSYGGNTVRYIDIFNCSFENNTLGIYSHGTYETVANDGDPITSVSNSIRNLNIYYCNFLGYSIASSANSFHYFLDKFPRDAKGIVIENTGGFAVAHNNFDYYAQVTTNYAGSGTCPITKIQFSVRDSRFESVNEWPAHKNAVYAGMLLKNLLNGSNIVQKNRFSIKSYRECDQTIAGIALDNNTQYLSINCNNFTISLLDNSTSKGESADIIYCYNTSYIHTNMGSSSNGLKNMFSPLNSNQPLQVHFAFSNNVSPTTINYYSMLTSRNPTLSMPTSYINLTSGTSGSNCPTLLSCGYYNQDPLTGMGIERHSDRVFYIVLDPTITITVAPNPVSTTTTVTYDLGDNSNNEPCNGGYIEVFAMYSMFFGNGAPLQTIALNSKTGNQTVDFTGYPPGIYYIVLHGCDGSIIISVITKV